MRLFILLFAAGLAFGQDKPADNPVPPKEPQEAEIITVKTLTGDSFDRLLRMLNVFPAKIAGDNQLRTILVYAPKDVVAQMRRVVEQLDRPGSEAAIGRNIDMTLTLLQCSTKPPATPAALPPDMEPVARQLRSATQYKDIQVWDVVPLRLQEGRDMRETLRLPSSSGFVTGTITMHPEAVYRKDQGSYVRFARMELDFRIPLGNAQFANLGINTSGDFQEGQKTVVGKVTGVEGDSAIFAVISLKVLD
jgi:hypothetical protein